LTSVIRPTRVIASALGDRYRQYFEELALIERLRAQREVLASHSSIASSE
jgi:hypothetical protein